MTLLGKIFTGLIAVMSVLFLAIGDLRLRHACELA